jgi:predicted acetylornithine/succinylornithine family transaminase
MASAQQVIRVESQSVAPTYGRIPLVLERGRGTFVWDADGKRYLDFIGGIATCPVGHANPALVRAIARQAGRLINASNLFYTAPQAGLARRLVRYTGVPGRVFFCNSGAEANEAAIKFARRATGRAEIVSADHGFHGRTLGALSATWKEAIQKPFRPLVPGFKKVPFGDVKALKKAVTRKTAAFLIEPIQGESGVHPVPKGYLRAAARICKARGALLVCDEVQCGLGRTGRFFGYQEEGVRPDIVTMAKGLGGGVPVGAAICTEAVAAKIARGDHGSTFGGNSLSAAAALAVLDLIEKRKLMKHARAMGARLMQGLRQIGLRTGLVTSVRGRGLMVGADIAIDALAVVQAAIRRGLIANRTGEKTLRFLPPMTVSAKEIDAALALLEASLREVQAAAPKR